MDDTDFDLLCQGLTTDEAKQLRKIFREWSNGDENGFPVQLALLTRAQWRAAAQMPGTLQKIITAFEAKLAAQQQHQVALMKTLREAGDEKIRAFDKRTGKVLWEAPLPAGGYATPTTYCSGRKMGYTGDG